MKRNVLSILLLACLLLMGCSGGNNNQDVKVDADNINQEVKSENTAIETTLSTGTFYVGEDIPAGRYIITSCESGTMSVSNSDDHSGLSAHLNPDGGGDRKGVVSVTYELVDGQEIQINGMDEVYFTPKE